MGGASSRRNGCAADQRGVGRQMGAMKKPAKPPAAPAKEDEAEAVLRTTLLCRYLRVAARHGDAIEVALRAGCRISIAHDVDAENRRSLRILVGPAPAGKPRTG